MMRNFRLTAAVSAILLGGGSFPAAQAGDFSQHFKGQASLSGAVDPVDSLRRAVGSRLVLIGRVDEIRSDHAIVVLGQLVESNPQLSVAVGAYVGVVGEPAIAGRVSADAVVDLGTPYIAGASVVSLVGAIDGHLESLGRVGFGSLAVDYTHAMGSIAFAAPVLGGVVEFRGKQPQELGVVVAEHLVQSAVFDLATAVPSGVDADGSLGTGRAGVLSKSRVDGSLGTGRAGAGDTVSIDGSLGTGRAGVLR